MPGRFKQRGTDYYTKRANDGAKKSMSRPETPHSSKILRQARTVLEIC